MIDAIELGATLFIPAIHKDLHLLGNARKYKGLKSLVIDLEDSLCEKDVAYGLEKLAIFLKQYRKRKLHIFVRPRDVKMLKGLLTLANIEVLDGFILPKFSLANAQEYIATLEDTSFAVMPSIEGDELFEYAKLSALAELLIPLKERIILVRFGLEDMFRQLGMRRDPELSPFDVSVSSFILGQFITLFKSKGFSVSGGVYPHFSNTQGFIREVRRDMQEGLISKTIIHPLQIDALHNVYKVSEKEYADAQALLKSQSHIINLDGSMGEVQTMSPYAGEILKREKIYGLEI